MRSLRARQLFAASIILAIFIALCGAGLERAFRSSAVEAERDRLEGLVFAILAAAEPNDDGSLTIASERLPDPRLGRPQSRLEAALVDERGALVWGSPSLEDGWSASANLDVGQWHFQEADGIFTLSFGLRWLDKGHAPRRYTLEVIENDIAFEAQLATYRRTLWSWLGGAASALLVVQLLVLNWSLTPLRKMASELSAIERGEHPQIEGHYPQELEPLTNALNSMIQNERNRQARYRNSLGDLAHSLKTPLAVLKGLIEEKSVSDAMQGRLNEPLSRIQQITDYQLRKAAMVGRRTLSEPLLINPLVEKISNALTKVYASKSLCIESEVPPLTRVRIDEGDLYEMLGNLMDNGCKWARSRVVLHVTAQGRNVEICVEDDGPGFPENPSSLIERGVRADNHVPGQGIGLAAAHELAAAYDGKLELMRSALGGAKVVVSLQT